MRISTRARRTLAAAVATPLLAGTGSAATLVPAAANPAVNGDERVAEVAASVARAVAAVGEPASVRHNPDVTLPSQASDRVQLGRGAGRVEFTQPGQGVGEQVGSAMIYDTPKGTFSTVSEHVEHGVRSLVVINEVAAPTAYAYDFSGSVAELASAADGGVVLVDGDGDVVGLVEAPWAVDAEGRDVPTHFEIDGLTLRQVVEHRGDFSYPVVADPSIRNKWYGAQVRFTKAETRGIASGVGYCAALAFTIRHWVAAPIHAYCAVLVGTAAVAQSQGRCLAVNVTYIGGTNPWYWNC